MSNSESRNMNASSPMNEIDFSRLNTPKSVLSIREHALLGHVNIRGSLSNLTFSRSVKKVLGVGLPNDANTYIEHDGQTILWLGPNEWLVVTNEGKAEGLVSELEKALGNTFSAINEVSGGNTVIEVSGDKAQALLRKGCPFDLHHSVFSTGQCAQTVIAKTSMILWQVSNDPMYKLIVRRSFADYLGNWLLDAARECRD